MPTSRTDASWRAAAAGSEVASLGCFTVEFPVKRGPSCFTVEFPVKRVSLSMGAAGNLRCARCLGIMYLTNPGPGRPEKRAA